MTTGVQAIEQTTVCPRRKFSYYTGSAEDAVSNIFIASCFCLIFLFGLAASSRYPRLFFLLITAHWELLLLWLSSCGYRSDLRIFVFLPLMRPIPTCPMRMGGADLFCGKTERVTKRPWR